MNRTSARIALLTASSLMVIASPAVAKANDDSFVATQRSLASDALRQTVENATRWTPTLKIVTNDSRFIRPGPGDPATGANYANSVDVLSTGVNGVGQMIALVQDSGNSAFLTLCTGTLINPRTVITAAHCVYDAPK